MHMGVYREVIEDSTHYDVWCVGMGTSNAGGQGRGVGNMLAEDMDTCMYDMNHSLGSLESRGVYVGTAQT